MGREVRRVPSCWGHPKNQTGHQASRFADIPAPYEVWMSIIREGSAPSVILEIVP